MSRVRHDQCNGEIASIHQQLGTAMLACLRHLNMIDDKERYLSASRPKTPTPVLVPT